MQREASAGAGRDDRGDVHHDTNEDKGAQMHSAHVCS
jgi:hypothetical protein